MGNYLTQTANSGDLSNAIGTPLLVQLCPDGAGAVDANLVSEVISDAEALVDSILGPGFTVPITSTIPRIVKRCAADIAVFYCYSRKPEFTRADGKNPMIERYSEATRILKSIRQGQQDMGTETTTGKSAVVGGALAYTTTPFIVDTSEDTNGPSGGF